MGGVDVKPVLRRGPPVYGWHYPAAPAAAPAAAAAPPVVKPEPQGPNTPITIRIKDQQGSLRLCVFCLLSSLLSAVVQSTSAEMCFICNFRWRGPN